MLSSRTGSQSSIRTRGRSWLMWRLLSGSGVGEEDAECLAGTCGIRAEALGIPVVRFLDAHRVDAGDERADAVVLGHGPGSQQYQREPDSCRFVEPDRVPCG